MGAARAAGAWLASGRLLLLCFDKSSFDWARAGILAGPFGSAAPTARLAFRPRPFAASGKRSVGRGAMIGIAHAMMFHARWKLSQSELGTSFIDQRITGGDAHACRRAARTWPKR
jgi:hypothetical protein